MKPDGGLDAALIVRFLQSGFLAALANLSTFHVLANIVGMWYLLAAPVAFFVGFCVSFTMQKFWTFRDGESRIVRQASLYFTILLINLCINTLIVYVLIENFQIWNVLAQALASIVIAFESFFVYRFVIFTTPRHES